MGIMRGRHTAAWGRIDMRHVAEMVQTSCRSHCTLDLAIVLHVGDVVVDPDAVLHDHEGEDPTLLLPDLRGGT